MINKIDNLNYLLKKLNEKENSVMKEDDREIYQDTLSKNNNTLNSNELKRTKTVNEINLIEKMNKENADREIIKSIVMERYMIVERTISSEQVLGLNVDLFI